MQQSPQAEVVALDMDGGETVRGLSGMLHVVSMRTVRSDCSSLNSYYELENGLPPFPPVERFWLEHGYHEVVTAKTFNDLGLSGSAAGFVSYRPVTMLLRRWHLRTFILLFVFLLVFLGMMYWPLEERPVQIDSPICTQMVAAVSRFFVAFLMLVAVAWAVIGKPRIGVVCIGVASIVNAATLFIVWAIWADLQGNVAPGVHRSLSVIVWLLIAYTCLWDEDRWWTMCALSAMIKVSTGISLYIIYRYDAGILDMSPGVIFLAMWMYFHIWRRRTLQRARRATKPDQLLYDQVWEPVRRDRRKELDSLAKVVNDRECKRALQPFVSLQVLFQRAYSLNVWYQQVVRKWACACSAVARPAPVKGLQRTLEKVQRSYKGKIPMITDIVRSTIVVDDIGDVQKVLEYVLGHAIVHQIKNRFDPSYNSEPTAGYRDLNVHLSFKELEATAFAGFVFELQIHYAAILAINNAEGHERYIRLRNLRGD